MHSSDTQNGQREIPVGVAVSTGRRSCGRNERPSADVFIAASIHTADRLNIAKAVALAEKAGCDAIHIDIMDGDFAPPIASGTHMIESIHAATDLPLDVHLQVAQPEPLVDAVLEAGCETLTFHVETTHHPRRLSEQVRAAGVKCGIGLNLATPLCYLEELLGDVDLVILMATNPGVSGYSPKVVGRVHRLHGLLDDAGLSVVRIGVDGGVSPDTARALYDVGATWLVAGSSLWRNGPAAAVTAIRANTNRLGASTAPAG